MSRASIRIILAELTAVLNHARVDGLITINPAGRLGKLYKQAPVLHEEIQPLMAEEVRLFLSAAQQTTPTHYPLFLAAIHTGLRSGECRYATVHPRRTSACLDKKEQPA